MPFLVQLEENYNGSIFPSIHVGNYTEEQRTCMIALWNEQDIVFPQNRIYKDEKGIWRPSDILGSIFVEKWMRSLAFRIATSCQGQVLSSLASKTMTSPTTREFGINPHPIYEPIEMHGGVMLGMQKDFLVKAKEDGLLLSPSRKMLFQQDKKDVHFWNFADSDKFGTVGQHIVIKEGSVTNITAFREGVLQFEIETKPFSIVRNELRAKKTDTFTKGLEWFGAKSDNGFVIYEKAAWLCDKSGEDNSPCIGIADLSEALLFRSYMSSIGRFKPLMRAGRVDDKWIVQIDITNFAADFDKQWEKVKSSDVNTQLSVIFNYSKWGFRRQALEKYEQIQKRSESVDTIILKLLENPQN